MFTCSVISPQQCPLTCRFSFWRTSANIALLVIRPPKRRILATGLVAVLIPLLTDVVVFANHLLRRNLRRWAGGSKCQLWARWFGRGKTGGGRGSRVRASFSGRRIEGAVPGTLCRANFPGSLCDWGGLRLRLERKNSSFGL